MLRRIARDGREKSVYENIFRFLPVPRYVCRRSVYFALFRRMVYYFFFFFILFQTPPTHPSSPLPIARLRITATSVRIHVNIFIKNTYGFSNIYTSNNGADSRAIFPVDFPFARFTDVFPDSRPRNCVRSEISVLSLRKRKKNTHKKIIFYNIYRGLYFVITEKLFSVKVSLFTGDSHKIYYNINSVFV